MYVQELESQTEQIDLLISRHALPADVRAWRAQTERVLIVVVGTRSIRVNQFNRNLIEPAVVPVGAKQDFFDEFYREGFAEGTPTSGLQRMSNERNLRQSHR